MTSKRQNQDPRADLPPFRVCALPQGQGGTGSPPDSPTAPSIPPVEVGRGAAASKEGLTWPSPHSSPPPFACPLVEMPLPWSANCGHRNGLFTYMGHPLGDDISWWHIHTLRTNTKQCCPWSWECQPTLGGRGMTAFAQAGTAYHSLLLHLWTWSNLSFVFPLPENSS